MPESGQRIEPCCRTGWNIAGQGGHGPQEQGNKNERWRIGCAHGITPQKNVQDGIPLSEGLSDVRRKTRRRHLGFSPIFYSLTTS